MTNSSITAESVASGPPDAAAYRWEVPEKSISVHLSLDVIDRMEREVLESFKAVTKRGSEVGGLLLGRVTQAGGRIVAVEQYVAVECDYSRGPLYLLADADKQRLSDAIAHHKLPAQDLSIVGFFRSNTRKDVALDEDDLALAQEYFSEPSHVFLLVKPFAMKPSVAGFFFWENGEIHGEASYLQFPFRRSELLKAFPQFITGVAEKPSGPLMMPKREERAPAPAPFRRDEDRAPTPPAAPKREERPPLPAVPSGGEEPPAAAAPPKHQERPVPPALSFRREERPVVTPIALKREERAAGPVPVPRREEPVKREEPPKREERPSVTLRREERPAVVPVTARREERPAPPAAPVTREEPPAPQPPAQPVVSVSAAASLPAPAKVETVAKPQPAPVKAEPEPLPVPALPEEAPIWEVSKPGLFARLANNRWVWAGVLAVLLLLIAGFFQFRTLYRGGGKPAEDSLGLTIERNSGQFMLKWNRNASLIATAQRATLAISDGDHKEDVDLDLGQLRSGSVVYSPITSDVSFRLEVTDIKHGKSLSESVRWLAGRPSPSVPMTAPPTPTPAAPATAPVATPAPAKPAAAAPDKPAAATPPPSRPAEPAANNGGAAALTPETAKPVGTPQVTLQPPRPQSLAARLSPAPQVPQPPELEGSANPLAGSRAVMPSTTLMAPPPEAPKPTPPPANTAPGAQAAKPAAQTPAQPARQAAPPPPARVGGNVQEAQVLRKVSPVYPALARQARVSGVVRVDATIGKDGRVHKATSVSGPPLLRQAASDAVSRWTFKPSMLNNEPVETTTQVDVIFNLNR